MRVGDDHRVFQALSCGHRGLLSLSTKESANKAVMLVQGSVPS
uniref:Uncharacterized protein n=1 Tax=Pygocentrus nattereri TaxID=42514 RepID=A0A3B4EJ38_PYGNA